MLEATIVMWVLLSLVMVKEFVVLGGKDKTDINGKLKNKKNK